MVYFVVTGISEVDVRSGLASGTVALQWIIKQEAGMKMNRNTPKSFPTIGPGKHPSSPDAYPPKLSKRLPHNGAVSLKMR